MIDNLNDNKDDVVTINPSTDPLPSTDKVDNTKVVDNNKTEENKTEDNNKTNNENNKEEKTPTVVNNQDLPSLDKVEGDDEVTYNFTGKKLVYSWRI